MTANPWRGEVEFLFNGRKHVLRPTFEALCRIEQRLQTGLIALARKLADGKLSMEELAVMIECCMQDSGVEIRESLLKNGIQSAMEAVSSMLVIALGGSGDRP